MVKVRCQDCGGIADVKKSEIDETSCDCGGDLAIQGSEDDTYEPEKCPICNEEVNPNDEGESWTCDECDEENICKDCIVEFENSGNCFCKKCVDEVYPRETKIEYKEKIVEKPVYLNKEGIPLDNSFNPNNKTKFD